MTTICPMCRQRNVISGPTCQPCGVVLSNRRTFAKQKGIYDPQQRKRHIQRRIQAAARAAAGIRPVEIPIAKVAWLDRPMPGGEDQYE